MFVILPWFYQWLWHNHAFCVLPCFACFCFVLVLRVFIQFVSFLFYFILSWQILNRYKLFQYCDVSNQQFKLAPLCTHHRPVGGSSHNHVPHAHYHLNPRLVVQCEAALRIWISASVHGLSPGTGIQQIQWNPCSPTAKQGHVQNLWHVFLYTKFPHAH